MSDPKLDPALSGALDRFTVPGLPADFADRVVEAALARDADPLPKPVPRRPRRTGWIRGHRVVIGAMAVGLMSAAAAATAIFADNPRTVPIIGPIIASVAPEKPAPKPRAHKPPPVRLTTVKPPEVSPEAEGEPQPMATPVERRLIRREVRRDIIAEKLVKRAEIRAERRAELGLPPRAVRPGQVVPVLRRLPPGERAAIIERALEIRQERRAGLAGTPDRAPQGDAPALVPEPMPATTTDAAASEGGDVQDATAENLRNPDRAEQLRRLRLLREIQQRRRDLRRQRQP